MEVNYFRVPENEMANYVFANRVLTPEDKETMLKVYQCLARKEAEERNRTIDVEKLKCGFLYGRCHCDDVHIECEDCEFTCLWPSENGFIMLEVRDKNNWATTKLFRCTVDE